MSHSQWVCSLSNLPQRCTQSGSVAKLKRNGARYRCLDMHITLCLKFLKGPFSYTTQNQPPPSVSGNACPLWWHIRTTVVSSWCLSQKSTVLSWPFFLSTQTRLTYAKIIQLKLENSSAISSADVKRSENKFKPPTFHSSMGHLTIKNFTTYITDRKTSPLLSSILPGYRGR